jgi:MFS family permease
MRQAGAGRIIAISVPGIMVSIGSLVIFTFGAFVKPLGDRLDPSRGRISLAFMVAALMVGFFSPILGRVMDRVAVRRVLLPSVGVYCAVFTSLAGYCALDHDARGWGGRYRYPAPATWLVGA